MTASLVAPAVQALVFALGCALIHAARSHAAAVTRVLTGIATLAGVLVLLAATAIRAPDDLASCDEITLYAALSGQQPGTR